MKAKSVNSAVTQITTVNHYYDLQKPKKVGTLEGQPINVEEAQGSYTGNSMGGKSQELQESASSENPMTAESTAGSNKSVVAANWKSTMVALAKQTFYWLSPVVISLVFIHLASKCPRDFIPTYNTAQSCEAYKLPGVQIIGEGSETPRPVSSFRIIQPPSSNFAGRHALLSTLHSKFQELWSNNYFMRRVMVLVGTSGVGKTETARQFAHKYREHYENVAWVDASTETSTKASFFKIATTLNVRFAHDAKGTDLARLAYRHINEHVKKTALFIFDNVNQLPTAEGGFGIYEYLPTERMENPPLILFTTQRTEWNTYHFEIMEVTRLSKEESVECLMTCLHLSPSQLLQDRELQDLLENLAERLYGYPEELMSVAATILQLGGQRSPQMLRRKLRAYIKWLDFDNISTVGEDILWTDKAGSTENWSGHLMDVLQQPSSWFMIILCLIGLYYCWKFVRCLRLGLVLQFSPFSFGFLAQSTKTPQWPSLKFVD